LQDAQLVIIKAPSDFTTVTNMEEITQWRLQKFEAKTKCLSHTKEKKLYWGFPIFTDNP